MKATEDQLRSYRQQYDAALATIRKTAAVSCPGKAGQGHEVKYGQAYQLLVNAGAAPKLRLKYRG